MQQTPSYSEGQKLDLTKLINKSPTLLKFVDEAPNANVASSVGRAFTDYTPLKFDAFGKAIENAVAMADDSSLMTEAELEDMRKKGIGFDAKPAGKDEKTGEQLFRVYKVSEASMQGQGLGSYAYDKDGNKIWVGRDGSVSPVLSEGDKKRTAADEQAEKQFLGVYSRTDKSDPKAVSALNVLGDQLKIDPARRTQLMQGAGQSAQSQQPTQSSQRPDIVQATDGKFYIEDPNGHVEMRGKKYKPATDGQIAGMKRE